ncbi:NAD(P)-dependent oxidoreductase [Planococcus salinus]|uniref:NAD(P)-dependent oxidoreductase n=1 Tax=Planococcus salinus TaxID=1848460 RepID=A0A3M8P7W7_9BACL|nr:NAD(P)-dependent oxidoreductase [Planococcus salinus]RNF39789.1 NAD(P)-dependent oxidoreductase [Planococcus salinus]
MSENKRIGFVGLGNMGYHMASNLAKAGHPLAIYDIRKEVVDSFPGEDVLRLSSPKEVADQTEIVLVSLPTPQVVKSVVLDENGLIYGSAIRVYIDLSTSGRTVSKEVGKALAESGIKTLDSPVSGGVPGAEKATLSIMVAGEKEIFDQCKHILDSIGNKDKVLHVGEEIGQAQALKVINNLLSSSALAITSEAMVLGVKAGLDPNVMIDVLNVSSGRNSATEDKFKKSIINRKFDYGFQTALAYKDIKLCLDLAADLEVPMFLGNNMEHFWKFAMTQGAGDKDYTTIIKYFEEWAGVEVKEQ